MTQSIPVSTAAQRQGPAGDQPSPEIAAFIRYCHSQHGASWPELYDEMCGVAARREFHGWDHDQLAARGLTFSLLEMVRLAGWSGPSWRRWPTTRPIRTGSGRLTPPREGRDRLSPVVQRAVAR